MDPEQPARRAFWISVAVSLAIVALTVVALQVAPPPSPPPGAGPTLPRMRGPVGSAGPGELLRAIGVGSLTWYVGILAIPLFIGLSRRMPLERGRWAAAVASHLAVVVVLVLGTAWLQHRLSYAGSPLAPGLGTYLRAAAVTGALPFLAVAALAQAVDASARARERALEAATVRARLAEARLESLTAQLQPHFLFNTLQGISTLIRADPEAADRMLGRLSDLLRDVLARSERREVPLEEELRVIGAYLDIARMRFGERLTIVDGVEAGARNGLVPFFVLQPLVENALRHGVERRGGAATVRIVAARRGERLELSVTDDGPGDAPRDEGPGTPGVGLSNTRARLEELYGESHHLECGALPAGGYRVRLEIPWRTDASAGFT